MWVKHLFVMKIKKKQLIELAYFVYNMIE